MILLSNPVRSQGLPADSGAALGDVVADPSAARRMFRRCPRAESTPLREMVGLADAFGVAGVHLKDESGRMGLGSLQALGATHASAREAAQRVDKADAPASSEALRSALSGEMYVCASAGNHGLSVAAGARVFGATAIVYLSHAVPDAFAARLHALGAEVIRSGDDYEVCMAAAAADADKNGRTLLSDSTWPGYVDLPRHVMEGYLIMGAEVAEQTPQPPTHVFLQASVWGQLR